MKKLLILSALLAICSTKLIAAPGLAAQVTQHSVTLSWQESGSNAGFLILRGSTASGPFVTINPSPVTASSYIDTNVTPGATYYYEVEALNTTGIASLPSNVASATVPSSGTTPPPPPPPTTYPFNLLTSLTPLSFSWTSGAPLPPSQSFDLYDNSPCPPVAPVPQCSWPATVTTDQPWLTATPASGTTRFTVSISANPTGMVAGTYTGNVINAAPLLAGSPLMIPVTLTIAGAAPPPPPPPVTISISPASSTIIAGAQQQFTATVSNSTNTGASWTSSVGTISSTGLLTAPSVAASGTVTATSSADSTKFATAAVTVSAPVPPPVISTKFAIGDTFKVNTGGSKLNVRSAASATASVVTTFSNGTVGTVVGGPTVSAGVNYWQVNNSTSSASAKGWVVEQYIRQ